MDVHFLWSLICLEYQYQLLDKLLIKQKYFNKKLFSACVVTENAYGMLKGCWRILYKQTECRMYNLKYVIMSCIMLHNLCISINDSCEPRWCLEGKNLSLIKKKKEKKTLFALKTNALIATD